MQRLDGSGAAARRRTRRRVDSVSRDGDGMVLMATRADDIAAPSKFALAAELQRAIWSITSHAFSREMLAAAPTGHGRPEQIGRAAGRGWESQSGASWVAAFYMKKK